MSEPLPGMPVRYGDAGLFVCGPEDIAPWEAPRPAARRPARPAAATRAPRPRPVWLVLALCPLCNPRTGGYCAEHRADCWWLENFRPGVRR